MAAAVAVDDSEIKGLVKMLRKAGEGCADAAQDALGRVVVDVANAARANAANFNRDSTGELARSVDYDRSGYTRRVFADVRQAFFLEYGSPTTGGPRPWLSAPAERGSARLAVELGRIGAIW